LQKLHDVLRCGARAVVREKSQRKFEILSTPAHGGGSLLWCRDATTSSLARRRRLP
jgi:hypothetical protein